MGAADSQVWLVGAGFEVLVVAAFFGRKLYRAKAGVQPRRRPPVHRFSTSDGGLAAAALSTPNLLRVSSDSMKDALLLRGWSYNTGGGSGGGGGGSGGGGASGGDVGGAAAHSPGAGGGDGASDGGASPKHHQRRGARAVGSDSDATTASLGDDISL